MKKELWIFAEQQDGVIASSYYEILAKAVKIYEDVADKPCFTAVYFGSDEAGVDQLRSSGAEKVIACTHEQLAQYNPAHYTAALTELAQRYQPEILLIAASAIGGEVAPSVALKLHTGLAAHCSDLRLSPEGDLGMIVPAFGGKLLGEIRVPKTRPVMASIKPGVFDKAVLNPVKAEIVRTTVSCLDTKDDKIKLVNRSVHVAEQVPVDKAEVVVCAGLGAATSGNLEKVKTFAAKLGAPVGYTRPLVDLGYFPDESAMVGTSGKAIKPKLYIGFGISGAAHHACGIKDSGLIININNDADADCFQISDYKVASDCGSILDTLLKQM